MPGLTEALDLPRYVQDAYDTSVARVERLDGEADFEWRMRKICYLHLTHFVRILLDRKDRMSMAVGLEVRVPFCDHRLVEYVYNAPWSLKTYDGREKSLLRGAARDVLPRSVIDRVKSPYPSTCSSDHFVIQRWTLGSLRPSGENTYSTGTASGAMKPSSDTVTLKNTFPAISAPSLPP